MSGLKIKRRYVRSISISRHDEFLIEVADDYIKNGNVKSFTELVKLALYDYLKTRSPQLKVMQDLDKTYEKLEEEKRNG